MEQYDLFADVLSNPNSTMEDLVVAGRTPENTELKDYDYYKNNNWVREQFKDLNGNFDELSYKLAYNQVSIAYNNLASYDGEEIIASQMSFGEHDIYAPVEQRRSGPEYFRSRALNPQRLVTGFVLMGRTEDPTLSIDEIALSNKVLINPTTAGDNLENALWADTPNGHFFKYFFDTLVLATYNSDGVHNDPITGEQTEHKKGDLRLNENGEFFYEKLDGRSIYGRLVLNKGNILTVDGSKLNQYDFFDSDGINLKHPVGTLLRNAALVGTMLINPAGIGTGIVAVTLGVNLIGLAGTLGKMLTGSENATFSAMEGWSKGFNRSSAKTEYALQHFWCWENMINLVGDFIEIPRTLEVIFLKVPILFKGGNWGSKKFVDKKMAEWKEARKALNNKKLSSLKDDPNLFRESAMVREMNQEYVLAALALVAMLEPTKSFMKLGEVLSKGYMALHIASDTYGEAKAAGASDMEATMLTLGYTAALYKFLGLGISKWIFPELRVEGLKVAKIAKALTEIKEDADKNLILRFEGTVAKQEKVKSLFNIGKKLAYGDYNTGTKTLASTLAGGIGMGVEGAGFEFLSDLSKGCYDVVKWLKGDEQRMETFGWDPETREWNIGLTLLGYGLNFLSAVIGGTITGAFKTFKNIRGTNAITTLDAFLQLVYMCRNGMADSFIRQVKKMNLGNKNVSTRIIDNNIDYVLAKGTREDNQDAFLKKTLIDTVYSIEAFLNAEGANISDDSLLDRATLLELRYSWMATHPGAAMKYKNDYLNLLVDIYDHYELINKLYASVTDTNKNGVIEDREVRRAKMTKAQQDELERHETEIKKLLEDLEKYKNGEKAYEYISNVLFSSAEILNGNDAATSKVLFAKQMYGKEWDKLTDIEKSQAEKHYKDYMEKGEGRDIFIRAGIFRDMIESLNDLLNRQGLTYAKQGEAVEKARAFIKTVSHFYEFNPEQIDATTFGEMIEPSAELQIIQNIIDSFGAEGEKAAANSYLLAIARLARVVALYRKGEMADSDALERYDKLSDQEKADALKAEETKLNEVLNLNIDEIYSLAAMILSREASDAFDGLSYAPTEIKNQLDKVLIPLVNVVGVRDEITDPTTGKVHNAEDVLNVLFNTINRIKDLPESPALSLIDEFAVAVAEEGVADSYVKVSDVLEEMNKLYNDTSFNIAEFKLDDNQLSRLVNAVHILQMYASTVYASKINQVGAGNIFGYSATLNEVAGKLKARGIGSFKRLAEIDSDTADALIEEINTVGSKMHYFLKLAESNLGSKMGIVNRAGWRKDMLTYKRVRTVFDNLDPSDPLNNWEGLAELLGAIGKVKILDSLDPSKGVSAEDMSTLEQEKMDIEDAIYQFFEKNIDKIKDPTKITDLINCRRFNLYDLDVAVMDNSTEYIDDYSILWHLCSRAAVRASDVYGQIAKLINTDIGNLTPIAPLPSLIENVIVSYAHVVNGDMFTYFVNGIKKAVTDDWKALTVDLRQEILRKYGITEDKYLNYCSSDKALDILFSMIGAVPTNPHVCHSDGVAGAGKTNGELQMFISLLKSTHPEVLGNVLIVHGGTLASALKLATSLGIAGAKALGIDEFTKEYIDNYSTLDPNGDLSNVPTDAFSKTGGEIYAKVQVKTSSEDPTLIIVDEVLRINYFLMEALETIATKAGISIKTLGDFDQAGVSCALTLPAGITISLGVTSTTMVHTPKMGISMRTNNTMKSWNLSALRARMYDPTHKEVNLLYCITPEEALYGDIAVKPSSLDKSDVNYAFTLKIIQGMIKTRSLDKNSTENTKIVFISDNPNSELLLHLKADLGKDWEDNVDVSTLKAAAGQEGLYYIIEISSDTPEALKELYTGMTRALQGSLIVQSPGLYNNIAFDSKSNRKVYNEPLNTTIIRKYAADRKKIWTELVPSPANASLTPRTKVGSSSSTTPTPPPPPLSPAKIATATVTKLPSTSSTGASPTSSTPPSTPSTPKNTTPPPTNDSSQVAANSAVTPDVILTTHHDNPSINWDAVSTVRSYQASSRSFDKSTESYYIKCKVTKDPDSDTYYARIVPPDSIENTELAVQLWVIDNYDQLGGGTLTTVDELYDLSSDSLEPSKATKWEIVKDITVDKDDNLISKGVIRFSRESADPADELKLGVDTPPEETEILTSYSPTVGEDEPFIPSSVDGGIAPIEQQEASTEEYNKSTNPLSDSAQGDVVQTAGGEYLVFQILHSFNTHDIGLEIRDGRVIISNLKLFNVRIDGANGLLKLINSDKPYEERLSLQQIDMYMGELWDVLINTKDKGDMIAKVRGILSSMPGADIPDDIYINFAYKQSTHRGNRGKDFVSKNPNAFSKDGEKTRYNGADEKGDPHEKAIVAIIGSQKRGSFLEIPLLALSSPFTIVEHFEAFKPLKAIIDQVFASAGDTDIGTRMHIAAERIILTYDADPAKWAQFKNIVALFRNYILDNYGILYIVTDSEGHIIPLRIDTDNWKSYQEGLQHGRSNSYLAKQFYDEVNEALDRSTWTPAKDLNLLGARMVNTRGEYQITPKYRFGSAAEETTYIPIKEAESPRRIISKKIYIASDDVISLADGRTIIIEKGNPFILVSHDRSIASDEAMYALYKALLAGAERKVEVVYVLAPKATVRLYIEGLDKVFTGKGNKTDIGYLFTSYRILQRIAGDEALSKLFKQHYTYNVTDAEGKTIQRSFFDDILLVIDQLLEMESRGAYDEMAELLFNTNNVLGQRLLELSASNRRFITPHNNNLSLSGILDFCLWQIGREEAVGLLLMEIVPEGISYNHPIDKNASTFDDLIVVNTDDNYRLANGESYLMNGKIDSYMFKADVSSLLEVFALSSSTAQLLSGSGRPFTVRISPSLTHYLGCTRKYTNSKTRSNASSLIEEFHPREVISQAAPEETPINSEQPVAVREQQNTPEQPNSAIISLTDSGTAEVGIGEGDTLHINLNNTRGRRTITNGRLSALGFDAKEIKDVHTTPFEWNGDSGLYEFKLSVNGKELTGRYKKNNPNKIEVEKADGCGFVEISIS